MVCKNCGKELNEGERFCSNCGTKVEKETDVQETLTDENVNVTEESQNQAEEDIFDEFEKDVASKNEVQMDEPVKIEPKNNTPVISKSVTKIGAAVLAVIVVVAAIIALIATRETKIDLDDYTTIECYGYDGYGSLTAKINWDAIEEKYGDKLKLRKGDDYERFYYGLLTEFGETKVGILKESVNLSFDKTTGLSNDDVVFYTWNIDEDYKEYFKCELKCSDGEYKVTGLDSLESFDAFKDVKVEFSGVAPKGKANINYLGSEFSSYDFILENCENLKNGDVVTVTIDTNAVEEFANEFGKIPAEASKEYTVSSLKSYLTKTSQIKEEDLKKMKKQASDEISANAAKNMDKETEKLEKATYLGTYLLTTKSADTHSSYNYLYLVYKIQVKNTYSYEEEKYNKSNTYYWFIRYDNVLIDEKGNVTSDLNEYKTPGVRVAFDSKIYAPWVGTQEWYYSGYETIQDLYSGAVTSYVNDYNHEDNVKA